MKFKILALIIFLMFPFFILRAEEISLTLEEAVALSLRENSEVLLKQEEVKKAKAKISESRADFFPTISFTGSWTQNQGYYSENLDQTTTQTTLKQYLYQGGKTINTLKYNGYNLEVVEALLDKTKLETIAKVEKAFYTLILANEFSVLNQKISENTNQHLNFLEERYKNGQTSKSDILKIKEALAQVEQAYQAALNQSESALALLKNLLALDKEVNIKAVGQFSFQPKEVSYDEAIIKALANRPEIRQYEAQTQADQKAVEIAKADGRPSIYASWDYYSRSHVASTTSIAKDWNDYNIVGVTFSWPIFDGWQTKAKLEQAIVDLKETQILKDKAIRDIALELKNAYLDLRNTFLKVKSTQVELDLYKDTLSVSKEKYRFGILSYLDLNDAILAYQVSLFNQKQAIYDYIVAKSNFNKATGGM
ncbi:MAG: TolC family protein [Candidatus Omnitrophica bacterium]|jgi:outer membrane protein TolC|nr:TolC family protein [Candidatus Omnitrophota bacterium]